MQFGLSGDRTFMSPGLSGTGKQGNTHPERPPFWVWNPSTGPRRAGIIVTAIASSQFQKLRLAGRLTTMVTWRPWNQAASADSRPGRRIIFPRSGRRQTRPPEYQFGTGTTGDIKWIQ